VWGKGRTECPWNVERKERGRWLVVAGFEPPPGCLVPPPPKSFPQIPPPRLPATRRVIPPAWHAEPLARRTEGTGLAWKAVAGWDLDHKSRLDTVPLSLWSDVAAVSMAVKRGLCAATQAFLQLGNCLLRRRLCGLPYVPCQLQRQTCTCGCRLFQLPSRQISRQRFDVLLIMSI
jgi:hypothetical protein